MERPPQKNEYRGDTKRNQYIKGEIGIKVYKQGKGRKEKSQKKSEREKEGKKAREVNIYSYILYTIY